MLLLIIYMLFLGSLLLIARFILQNQFTRIVNETSLVTADNRILERKVEVMNNFIKDASVAEKQFQSWTPFVITLTRTVPAGVIFESITIDPEKKVTLTGNAKTRSDLLQLKDNLEALEVVEKINLPVEDLVKPTNVPFKIQFEIDVTSLNNKIL
jgi:Tfp pilus assembly protein PilN